MSKFSSEHYLLNHSLKILENDFRCKLCRSLTETPRVLGGCDHIYCSNCCQSLQDKSCVVCHIPVCMKEAKVDKLFCSLLNECKRLTHILDNPEVFHPESDDVVRTAIDNEATSAEGVNSSDRPNLSLMRESSNESSDDDRRERPKVTSKQKQQASGYSESAPVITNRNTKGQSISTQGRRRRTRSTGPGDQTTMTQFFDNQEVQDKVSIKDRDSFKAEENVEKMRESKRKGVNGMVFEKAGKTTGTKTLRMRKLQASDLANMGNYSSLLQDRMTKESELESAKSKLVPSEKKKARRSIGGSENVLSVSRKASRRSLPVCLNEGEVSMTTSSRKAARIPFRQQRNRSPMNSSLNTVDKGNSLNIDKKNAKGETALQVACIKGDLGKVKALLFSGANPNTRDNAGWTPLHEACHYGHLEISERLLQAGALVDVPGTDNETPLHDAVRHMRTECVKLLVQHGASLNARNIKGLTPLDLTGNNRELRAALQTEAQSVPTPSTVQVDPLLYQRPCFLSTGLSREQKISLQKCASKLQAQIAEDFSPEVTHIVTACNSSGLCPRTMKYLQGVLTGRWIVNKEWVEMNLEFGSKVCEEAFEIPGTSSDPESGAAQRGRINRQHQRDLTGVVQADMNPLRHIELPGLFDGCQFYFHGNFEYPTPEKEELISLVKLGGGHVMQREPKPGHIPESDLTVPYHAPPDMATCCIYVVHDNKAEYQPIRTPHMSSVKASWLMDCISQFRLLSLAND